MAFQASSQLGNFQMTIQKKGEEGSYEGNFNIKG